MKLSLARDVAELDRIVAATRAYFAEHHIPQSLAYTVDLATEELFVNILRHGGGERDPVLLEMCATEDGVAVTLSATSPLPFDPRDAPEVDTRLGLQERRPGGLGLHLVKTVVSSLDYQYQDRESRIRFTATARTQDA